MVSRFSNAAVLLLPFCGEREHRSMSVTHKKLYVAIGKRDLHVVADMQIWFQP